MTKQEWLEETVMCDEYGRPNSLADLPMHWMNRQEMFELQGGSREENPLFWASVDRIWEKKE